MPDREHGPASTPQPPNGEPKFTPSRERAVSRPKEHGTSRRDRLEGVRHGTEEIRHRVEPAVEHIAGEPVAHATGGIIHGAGELVGRAAQVEDLIEDVAEVSSEGGIVLLQKATAFGDKHIPGFTKARKAVATGIEKTHGKYIDWRAQSMVDHPHRLWNRLALNTMLRQTVKESTTSWVEKWRKEHPLSFQAARSPLTAAEFASLLPIWYPLPRHLQFLPLAVGNPFLPLPIFLNQAFTLIAVNGRRAVLGFLKAKPMEFAIYTAFSVLDFVVPLLNAYPISPVLDTFISNHYHRRRRAYIAKAEQKLAEGGRDAIQLSEFLAPKIMRARRAATIYRGATTPHQLQETLARQKRDLFAEKPVKNPQSNLEQPSLKQRLQEKPVIKIPLDTYDLIKDVRRHLEILRWKGKVESVEELEALIQLFLSTQPVLQKQEQ